MMKGEGSECLLVVISCRYTVFDARIYLNRLVLLERFHCIPVFPARSCRLWSIPTHRRRWRCYVSVLADAYGNLEKLVVNS